MRLLEMRQFKELAKVLGRPQEHIDIAVAMIRHLNPRPGVRYSGRARARSSRTSTSSAMATISSFR
jgi:DNA-directed RNA polymerase specialized sigma54-like protein